MTETLHNLIYFIFGDPKKNSLEHRLFNTISLVNGLLNILGAIGALSLENFEIIFLLDLTSGLLMIGMYFLSRVKSIYYNLFWPFNLTILTYLSVTWFFNGGSVGGNHYYFIPALVIATILLRDHKIWFLYFVYIAVTGSLFIVEYFHREWISGYPMTEQDRFSDAGGNYIFVQILTGILIFILTRNLNIERKKSDNLLLNILPESIADELKQNNFVVPVRYESVSILFTDMAGFTKVAEKMTPEELIGELDVYFRGFDSIIKNHKMEKIKTIGDAYMAVGGLPKTNFTHAIDAVLCGLEFQRFMADHKEIRQMQNLPVWELRLGIHSGHAIAGVVGTDKFAYDIWGDSVNTASRLESSGIVGEVNISSETYALVKDFFECEHRGKISAKNKGEIDMYLVKGIRESLRNPLDVLKPNSIFNDLYKAASFEEIS
jgi:adenylate cyclase